MRFVGVVGVMAVVACTIDYSSKHGDAGTTPPPDACPVPMSVAVADCEPGGLAKLAIDGTWHETGTSSYTFGSNSSTAAIDVYITIQRFGCQVGIGSGSNVPQAATPFTYVSDTYLAYECSYYSQCPRGMEHWSICVRSGDGVLRYTNDAYGYSTGLEWISRVTAVLTR